MRGNVSTYVISSLLATLSLCASGYGQTTRVSVDAGGTEATNHSYSPSISADGRFVAFSSHALNLVSGDTNGQQDIFVHDTQSGETTLVSVDNSGIQGNGVSYRPSMSANGRYVAFESDSTNLVAGDTEYFVWDVFVRDTTTGVTTRVSVSSAGEDGNGGSGLAAVSGDGRYVAFASWADNLVSGDTNEALDVFVHDTHTGTTTRLSVNSSEEEGDYSSTRPRISADGSHITFDSLATNLVGNDTNGTRDVFVRDTQTGTTTRVNVNISGGEGDYPSDYGSVSADGRYVAFQSYATNLVSGDTNNVTDIFVRDTIAETTTRVNINSSGEQAYGGYSGSWGPSISADGRYVAFSSDSSTLVSGDTNDEADVFVHDTYTRSIRRVSVNNSGGQGSGYGNYEGSRAASISGDGRYVAFESFATNLVNNDTNAAQDIFVHDTRWAPPTPTPTATPDGSHTIAAKVTRKKALQLVCIVKENGTVANGASVVAEKSTMIDGEFQQFGRARTTNKAGVVTFKLKKSKAGYYVRCRSGATTSVVKRVK